MTDEEKIKSISLNGEIWKDVVGYEGIYKVSSLGRVMNVLGGERRVKFHILRPTYNKATNYLSVCLYKLDKQKRMYVHRIVATSFLDNPNGYKYVDHINTVRHDNRAENLRWVSIAENLNNPRTKDHASMSKKGTYHYVNNYHQETRKIPKRRTRTPQPLVSTDSYLQSVLLPNEEWKPVVGLESSYMISSFGRVISLPKPFNHNGKISYSRHRLLKHSTSTSGYYRVCLNGKFHNIHRLIAQAYIQNPEGKPCVDHINTIKTDNRIENLRWVSQKDNMNNPITLKLLAINSTGKKQSSETIAKRVQSFKGRKRSAEMNERYRAAQQSKRKPILQKNLDGLVIKRWDSIAQAAAEIHISKGLISVCCQHKQKETHGFIWEYDTSIQ